MLTLFFGNHGKIIPSCTRYFLRESYAEILQVCRMYLGFVSYYFLVTFFCMIVAIPLICSSLGPAWLLHTGFPWFFNSRHPWLKVHVQMDGSKI